MSFKDRLIDTTAKDFISLYLGTRIGGGMSRQVYENLLDPTTVIKVEEDAKSFQNVMEAELWAEVQYYKPMARWFAPVVAVSPNGCVLIQKKVERPYKKDYPAKIPDYFTDIKPENFGLLDGRLVCFDYGTPRISRGFKNNLKSVKWNFE